VTNTIELEITTITEDISTWPKVGMHCLVECRTPTDKHFVTRRIVVVSEDSAFLLQDSHRNELIYFSGCIGLRWTPFPSFQINDGKKENSSFKKSIKSMLIDFAQKINLSHNIGNFEIGISKQLFTNISYELACFSTYPAWNCRVNDLSIIKLFYNANGNALNLKIIEDEYKKPKLQWKSINALKPSSFVILRDKTYKGPTRVCLGHISLDEDSNCRILNVTDVSNSGNSITKYTFTIVEESNWEYMEISE